MTAKQASDTEREFTLSDFDYDLPDDLIAQEPAQPRDHARLLVYDRASGTITDDYFYNLDCYLPRKTSLVLNNSKVEKCRLLFDNKEIFVLNVVNPTTVEAMVRPGKKFKKGRTVTIGNDVEAEVQSIDDEGIRTLTLSEPIDSDKLAEFRHTPFPPYIEQNEELADEYQTVYAKDLGSKAAPTAGLHFTDELLQKLEVQGIHQVEVTLHVGLGTFAPVKEENIDEHTMHSEWFSLNKVQARQLNASHHITAVGTTSVRVLESTVGHVKGKRHFEPTDRDTDIFIKPGYEFQAVDSLITNFHLPKSTLLMLVAAFIGYDEMRRIYEHAIEEQYRFYSFGDAMLIV
jgi:S-adenosylmethionine:tRNA ribosyltransferase-isomerase